jgi:hypothetical protein
MSAVTTPTSPADDHRGPVAAGASGPDAARETGRSERRGSSARTAVVAGAAGGVGSVLAVVGILVFALTQR